MKGGTFQINWHDTKPVLTLDFHPFSGLLATAGADFDIKLFEILGEYCEKLKRIHRNSNITTALLADVESEILRHSHIDLVDIVGQIRTSREPLQDAILKPNVDFRHYAGYVNVNESHGRALFYWFYEAWTLPDEKPLVLWLNGGPGCSSVGYGATQEIGPFIVRTDGKDLQLNPYSWSREANMLFLESPVGVGFSYSNKTNDYDNLGDDFTANDAYAFLHNWFLKFPSYKNRTFYIAGESYAGKYVPELAELIHDKNKDPLLFINLKGILLGNPETSDAEDWKGMIDYAWSHAVVSDETHKIIRESCDFTTNQNSDDCYHAVDEVLIQYEKIDIYSLYTPVCIGNSAYAETKSMYAVAKKTTSKMIGDGEKEYTDDDLDQIREEWAQYLANFIFRS